MTTYMNAQREKKRRLNDCVVNTSTPLTANPFLCSSSIAKQNCKTMEKNSFSISSGIDTDLYSRQIGTFGFETMGKLIKMKVFISGLAGLGVECAKNIILAGPRSVCLHDPCVVSPRDLGSNFYLTEEDITLKRTHAEGSYAQLQELNHYVAVSLYEGEITQEFLKQFDVVVFSNTPKHLLVKYNEICRAQSPPIGFIAADCFGLAAYVFVDFGEKFVCFDKDGEEPKSAILAGITHEETATVHTHTDKRLPFQTGDFVVFSEVQGMVEINELPPMPIKVTGNNSFMIGDTSHFNPYTREGIVTQVKMPAEIIFKSFEEACRKPIASNENALITADFAKLGHSEQLHYAISALFDYRDQHGYLPPVRDISAFTECLERVKQQVEAAKVAPNKDGMVILDTIDETIVKNTIFYATSHLSPMAAYIGGIVSQEIVKFTGKYTPLHQWLYVDNFEALPTSPPTDYLPLNSRYDDEIAIWGKGFVDKLHQLKVFVVGAGALGCEFLKCLALMGCCCGENGKLTITDNDRIEISNLNRQFLFHLKHVGTSKSITAANAAKLMNPSLQILAMENRIEMETEDIFDDEFWEKQTLVINALDNVKSRQYVDGRCVWYGKPLLESGTLGTKASVQVILPHKTQSYSESQDPPEESIPLCTLKHFPHAIEHTIEWSRDAFEGLFVNGPQEAERFLKEREEFFRKMQTEGSPATQRERLRRIYDVVLAGLKQKTLEHCVEKACFLFQDFFHNTIEQLLYNFPLDHVTSSGQPFWSGPKRPPMSLEIDVEDETTLLFLVAAANLFAFNLGIPACRDVGVIKSIANTVRVPAFRPKQLRIKVDENDPTVEGAGDDEAENDCIKQQLLNFTDTSELILYPVSFEKDDDSNFHVAFITACANLRARNYKIAECSYHRAKMIAGKIIPAIATTTAMTAGLVTLELLKAVTHNERPLEDFKNAFINLALPLWLYSEPLPPTKVVDTDFDPVAYGPVKARPNGFTCWDKIEVIYEHGTIRQLLVHLKKHFNMDVTIVSSGSACLYNAFLAKHKQRLERAILEVYEEIVRFKLPINKKYLTVEVSGNDVQDGVEVIIPSIRYQFR